MESAGLRLPRWFQTAERILEEQREIEQGDEGQPVGETSARPHRLARGRAPGHRGFIRRHRGRPGGGPRAVRTRRPGRRRAARVPGQGLRVLRRARLRIPDHAVGWDPRREPGPRRDGRARDAPPREHVSRTEGDARGRPAPRGRPDVSGRGPPDRSSRPVGGRRGRLRSLRDPALVLLTGAARPPPRVGGASRRLGAPRGGVRPRRAARRSMALRRWRGGHLRRADGLPPGGHAGDPGDRGRAAPHRAGEGPRSRALPRVVGRRRGADAPVRTHAPGRGRRGLHFIRGDHRHGRPRAPGVRSRAGHLGHRGVPAHRGSARVRTRRPRVSDPGVPGRVDDARRARPVVVVGSGLPPSRRVEPARVWRAGRGR